MLDFFVYLRDKAMSLLNFLDFYYGFTLLAYMASMKFRVPALNWYKKLMDKKNLTDLQDWIAGAVLLIVFLICKSGMDGRFNFNYLSSVGLTAILMLFLGSMIVAYIKKKAKEKEGGDKKG